MSIDPNKVDADTWGELVFSVKESREKDKKDHEFLIINQGQIGRVTAGKWKGEKKLSLSDIAKISIAKFKELEEQNRFSFSNNEDVLARRAQTMKQILSSYGSLLKFRDEEITLFQRLLRKVAFVFVGIISIPVGGALLPMAEKILFPEAELWKNYKALYENYEELFKTPVSTEKTPVSTEKTPVAKFYKNLELREQIPDLLSQLGYDEKIRKEILEFPEIPHILIYLAQITTSKGPKELEHDREKIEERAKNYIDHLLQLKKEFGISLEQAEAIMIFKERLKNEVIPNSNNSTQSSLKTLQERGRKNWDKIDWSEIDWSQTDNLSKFLEEHPSLWSEQFHKDIISRANSFLREDRVLKIKDDTPIPTTLLPSSEERIDTEKLKEATQARLKEATRALLSLGREGSGYEKDLPWIKAVHVFLDQTTGNALSFGIVNLGQAVALINGCKLSPRDVPIKLNVIRDEMGDITKIQIAYKRPFDLTEQSSQRVLFSDACTGEVSYTMTLGQKKEPVISDFSLQFKTSL